MVSPDGHVRPMGFRWEDGRVYKIDRLLHAIPAPALKAGGQGMRYTVIIEGQERYIFCEDGRWFIEAK